MPRYTCSPTIRILRLCNPVKLRETKHEASRTASCGSFTVQAKTGYFLHGKRAMLSEWRTAAVLKQGLSRISPWLPGIGLWTYSLHSEALARVFSYDSRDWHDTQPVGTGSSGWVNH